MNFQDIIREVYDGNNKALKTTGASSSSTVYLGTPTLYAVVNTGSASDPGIFIGLTTAVIGNPTLYAVVNTSAPGITNSIVTVANTVAVTFSGNVTLSDAKTYIGLVTSTIGNNPVLGSGVGSIGFVSISNTVTVAGDVADAGSDSGNPIKISGKYNLTKPTYSDGQRATLQMGSRGALTVQIYNADGTTALSQVADNVDGVGTSATSNSMKVVNRNLVFNGTTWDRMPGNVSGVYVKNAGTIKSLVQLPFSFGASVATIAVPTNANVMYITNMILSANATTQVRMKSGVTYMTGNASIGISLNPNGGYVLTGAPDSPSWIGCPSGAVVLEKNDATTLVGGHLIYFQE